MTINFGCGGKIMFDFHNIEKHLLNNSNVKHGEIFTYRCDLRMTVI